MAKNTHGEDWRQEERGRDKVREGGDWEEVAGEMDEGRGERARERGGKVARRYDETQYKKIERGGFGGRLLQIYWWRKY